MMNPVQFHLETRRWGAPAGFSVVAVELREALSSVGGATVTLVGAPGHSLPFDVVELLGEPVTLTFDAAGSRAYHGLVVSARAELRESIHALVLEIAPRLWRASRSRRSRVYLGLTVADIVRRVLQENGFLDDDWSWRCTWPIPPRPYVVQFEESDLDFLHRTLEREGVFYVVTHRGGRDHLVFADNNNAFAPLAEVEGALGFAPQGGGRDGVAGVRTWRRTARLQPRAVAVRDYQPGAANVVMNTRLAPVMADRWTVAESGLQSFYGDHVATPDEATRMARLRAELQRCAIDRYDGVTQVTAVCAGAAFTLHDHPDATWQQAYVPVRVTHRYSVERTPAASAASAAPHYENLVEAIPQSVAFRPERVTPRPQMPPWIPAVIDSPANVAQINDGAREKLASPLDEDGRYFVVFPFDTVAAPGVAASCPIPLAQNFAGSGFGQHHPLHQGTHVLVGHIHGDPDRPVIVAALMASVVHPVASGGLLRTRGGVIVEYEDHAAPWDADVSRRDHAARALEDPHRKK